MIDNSFIDPRQAQEIVEAECERTVHYGKRGHDFKEGRLGYTCIYCSKTIMKPIFFILIGIITVSFMMPIILDLI